jgi:hypothetical protein
MNSMIPSMIIYKEVITIFQTSTLDSIASHIINIIKSSSLRRISMVTTLLLNRQMLTWLCQAKSTC